MEKLPIKISQGTIIFLAIFIFSIIFQSFIWAYLEPKLVDKTIWTNAMIMVAKGDNIGPSSLLYGYPALTLLTLGKIIIGAGFDPITAFLFTLVFFISLGIAGIVALTYIIEPLKPWWIVCFGLVSFSPHLPNATPPSIIVSVLVPFIMLLVLFLVKNNANNIKALILIGIIGGLSMSTRIDITLAVSSLATLLLIPKFKFKVAIPILIAFLIFCSLSFYIGNNPLGYFVGTYTKSHLAYTGFFGESSSQFFNSSLLLSSLLAFTTLIIGIFQYLFKSLTLPLPRNFFLWFVLSTCFISLLIYSASFHPVWYFIPLIISWEIFLPLFVFSIAESLYFRPENSKQLKKINFSVIFMLFFIHLCPFVILLIP